MQEMRDRARELLPQVLLTVLSIIQALALEVLWSSAKESPHLWNGGLAATIGWLQVSGVFLGILVMWLFYVSLVLRYRWTPTFSDSVVPFVLGVLEFLLAEMLEPERLHWWCYVLALIFVGASATSMLTIRHALMEAPAGEHAPAGFSVPVALLQAGSLIGTLVVAGLAVQWAGPDGVVAFCAVLAANGVLLVQASFIRYYWYQSLVLGPPQ